MVVWWCALFEKSESRTRLSPVKHHRQHIDFSLHWRKRFDWTLKIGVEPMLLVGVGGNLRELRSMGWMSRGKGILGGSSVVLDWSIYESIYFSWSSVNTTTLERQRQELCGWVISWIIGFCFFIRQTIFCCFYPAYLAAVIWILLAGLPPGKIW